MGIRLKARTTAINADLPVIPGTDGPIENFESARVFADEAGYPLMIKATSGGGGKGMRIVREANELEDAFHRAKSEAENLLAIVKYILKDTLIILNISKYKLLEMNLAILCIYMSVIVQHRHQKLLRVAPSVGLSKNCERNL